MKAHSHSGGVPEFAKTWSTLQAQVFLKPIRSDDDYRKMVALANELAADNIIVNAVHPGITDTEGASGMPNEQKAQVYMQQAIKRLGTPADIAGPVAFLTSDDARFVTGQTLVVDGGWMRL